MNGAQPYDYRHAGPSHQPYPAPTVEAIPQPQPKVAYQAPVFRTFQDRKRSKDMALRAAAGLDVSDATSIPSPTRQHAIPSAALAMMGRPSDTPPLPPPPRGVSPLPPSPSQSQFRRPLPSPTSSQALPPNNFSPVQATIERSDTISSVRSLDRIGFSSPTKRPLPKPPVGIASSKSLDRGMPGSPGEFVRRKQPSTVQEEEEVLDGLARVNLDPGGGNGHPPRIELPGDSSEQQRVPIPTFNIPDTNQQHRPTPTFNVPAVSEPDSKAPAKFTPLPAINLPGDDDGDDPSPHGIAFTGLPTIAVTSERTELSPTPTRVESDSAIVCSGCDQPIIGRIVNAMSKRFHPQCFRCAECGEHLEHVSSYEWEGQAYCHLDYHDKFAHRCFHCKTPIVDPRFVTLNDDVLGQRYYHELHFFCSECGDPFLDPSKSSAPGAERTRSDDDETNAFVIHKGHPYCERCHLRLHKPKCKACAKPIPDVAVNAMGARWHQGCFTCQRCQGPFANNLFFPKDGKAFCTECYESA